jgi:hypothetical protein
MSNKAGVERETWGEMGAKDRGGSDTSWCVDRYELTRACSAVSFCHPSSSVCPSDRSDRSIGSDRIDRIGLDEARPRPFTAPPSSSSCLAPLSHTRAAAAAVVVVGGRVAIATSRRRGSLAHARARRSPLPPSLRPSHNKSVGRGACLATMVLMKKEEDVTAFLVYCARAWLHGAPW